MQTAVQNCSDTKMQFFLRARNPFGLRKESDEKDRGNLGTRLLQVAFGSLNSPADKCQIRGEYCTL